MYKFLLCWRYLRTRYIALASIVSVMLGVATMIVVNAVMAGFTTEMQNRIYGILSDISVESHGLDGFENPDGHMQAIREVAGQWIEGMTPTVHVPALLSFHGGDRLTTRQIMFIGIDEDTYSSVSDFGKYLQHPKNRERLSFSLHDGGYDVRDHQLGDKATARPAMERAGWQWRRFMAEREAAREEIQGSGFRVRGSDRNGLAVQGQGAVAGAERDAHPPYVQAADGSPPVGTEENPFDADRPQPIVKFDPSKEQHTGVVMGIAIASNRDHQGVDRFLTLPGDDIIVSVPTAGDRPQPAHANFTIVDFYESKMSEYDSTFVFAPIKKLQQLRGMGDNVTSVQIKLKSGVDAEMVRDKLRQAFPAQAYGVFTWRDKQGPLLAAVQLETIILNILLFMIIAVAGFGILAIFCMIVVEKTRDIGILKSLGASRSGIMGMFLTYGMSLGLVGACVGLGLGLLFIHYINQVRHAVEWMTGQPAFDPSVYYFNEIPTIVEPLTVAWILGGAMFIAVLASVWPAFRAARLHPVEALRYE